MPIRLGVRSGLGVPERFGWSGLLGGADQLSAIAAQLSRLSDEQLAYIDSILKQLLEPFDFNHNPQSDLISPCVLQHFGDVLRIHHLFSAEPFTKDRFEYALEKTSNDCGIPAVRATRGNPGHDITIRDTAFSLKTEASRGIKSNVVHISKFMELGRGQWSDQESDLIGLRDRFFHHMRSYERIVMLRRLPLAGFEFYELVEIPKALLLEAANGKLEMMMKSKQMPKPGYCTVRDAVGSIKFQLYFDGGTERKLQIKGLDKHLCTVHATWQFPATERVSLL